MLEFWNPFLRQTKLNIPLNPHYITLRVVNELQIRPMLKKTGSFSKRQYDPHYKGQLRKINVFPIVSLIGIINFPEKSSGLEKYKGNLSGTILQGVLFTGETVVSIFRLPVWFVAYRNTLCFKRHLRELPFETTNQVNIQMRMGEQTKQPLLSRTVWIAFIAILRISPFMY